MEEDGNLSGTFKRTGKKKLNIKGGEGGGWEGPMKTHACCINAAGSLDENRHPEGVSGRAGRRSDIRYGETVEAGRKMEGGLRGGRAEEEGSHFRLPALPTHLPTVPSTFPIHGLVAGKAIPCC